MGTCQLCNRIIPISYKHPVIKLFCLFFGEVIEFIISGPVILLALEKENAIEDWRKLMGVTDSQKAASGTIRQQFGTDIMVNATHGSDSVENAQKELALMFPDL